MLLIFNKLRLQTKLVLFICFVILVPIVIANLYIFYFIHKEHYARAGEQADNVATIVANSPLVIEALDNYKPHETETLATYLKTLEKVSQVEFIVIIDMNGIRIHHPKQDKIGKKVVGGDEIDVLHGKSYISSAMGTLGYSQRAFGPIFAADKRQVGAVIVGIMSEDINQTALRFNKPIVFILFITLIFGILLAMLLAKSIKNILFGLEPSDIAKLLEERTAVLKTVREGVVAINQNGYLTVLNDAAKKLLQKTGQQGNLLGKKVDEVIPNTRLIEVMASGKAEYDCEQNLNGVVILTNRTPLIVNGVKVGAIATFRDMTEVRQLAERLTGVNNYADALRSQSHEFLNKLHVIYGLLTNQNYTVLQKYLNELIGNREKEAHIIYDAIHDEIIAGFLSSKFSLARELGIELHFTINGTLPVIADSKKTHCMITILGNLIENAIEAVSTTEEKSIDIMFSVTKSSLEIEVQDTGQGMPETDLLKIFNSGYSTKGVLRGFGLYLVLAAVDEFNGKVEVVSKEGRGSNFHVIIPLINIFCKMGAEE